jgi:hypothetical protein
MLAKPTFRAPFILTVLVALLFNARTWGQCPRSWIASPNGVYDGSGLGAAVMAMTEWTPSGSPTPVLVVGGNFLAAGDISANNVAYWDGTLWHSLGWGLNAPVKALAVLNGVLYAGGEFTNSGGATPLHYFAQWTGSVWQDAGFGTDGPVYSLANLGSELLLGGSFSHVAGGLLAYRFVARFSPGTWNGYPTAPPAFVSAVAALNGQPIILCNDADYHDLPEWTQTLRTWSGTQWGLIDRLLYGGGLGVDGGVLYYSRLARSGEYVADPLCQGHNYNEQAIFAYNGNQRTASLAYHHATSFASYNGQFYALGYTNHFCPYANGGDSDGPWLGTWNGTQWLDISSLSPGLSGGLLAAANGVLYVGGGFDSVMSGPGALEAKNIARLIGFGWQPLGVGLNGGVTCACPGRLEVGGVFDHEGSTSIPFGAGWNGQEWILLAPFNAPATSLFIHTSNPFGGLFQLVASGQFTQIGTTTVGHIAVQDPTTFVWSSMGTGIDAPALAMMDVGSGIHHNDLIVGGQFITAGGLTANHTARWTGSAWATLGTGTDGDVRALAGYGGIVAGGSFATAGGTGCSNIAVWNGTAWGPLGSGLNGAVRALAGYNGLLIAGGDFTMAGAVQVAHLAAWNGTSWSAFNGGTDGPVNAMVVSGTDLIIGGSFAHAGAAGASNIADWDGTMWNAVGYPVNGMDGPVLALTVNSGTLLAGGTFTHAGGQYSPSAALALVPGSASITQQPTDAATCLGRSASFAITVDPGAFFVGVTYNWYRNGTLINDGASPSGTVYTQSHTATLLIDNAQFGDATGYSCTATTGCAQSLTSNTVQLAVGGAACCGSADFNCDGDTATDLDIESFFACLAGSCPPPPCTSTADFNGDGDSATDADIEAFFRVLAGGSC